LRRQQTEAEAVLWSELRGARLAGAKFRRQFPIGNFSADFCCRARHLVIELDGSQHMEPAHQRADRRRTELMATRE
jgi:very-short-patch-repair endonuclease